MFDLLQYLTCELSTRAKTMKPQIFQCWIFFGMQPDTAENFKTNPSWMPRMLSDPSHANVSSLFTSNDLCFCAPALARKRPLHVLSPASLCFGAWGARRCYIRTTLNLQKRKRPIALPETLMEQMWTVGTNNRYRKSSRSRNTLASQGFLKPGGTTAATKAFSWWTKRISDADEMVMLEHVTEIFVFCTT